MLNRIRVSTKTRVRNGSKMLEKPALTGRELQTLSLIAEGYSDLEIAEALNTQPSTIRNKLCTIRLKLAVLSTKSLSKRANLAMFYKEHFAPKNDK